MTTTTTRDTRTAQQTYDENMAAIQAAIRKLQAGLKKHRKEQARDPKSYGFAGDLSYVADLLGQAARFIHGEDE